MQCAADITQYWSIREPLQKYSGLFKWATCGDTYGWFTFPPIILSSAKQQPDTRKISILITGVISTIKCLNRLRRNCVQVQYWTPFRLHLKFLSKKEFWFHICLPILPRLQGHNLLSDIRQFEQLQICYIIRPCLKMLFVRAYLSHAFSTGLKFARYLWICSKIH